MVHETITFQDGRYRRAVSETGAFEVFRHGNQIENRDELAFVSAGTPFSVSVSRTGDTEWFPVVGGAALINYDVDFFPIMHDAGLVNASFVQWAEGDITSSAKSRAQSLAFPDKASPEVRADLPPGQFLQDGIINGLYIDSLIGQAYALPISVDHHCATLIQRGNSRISHSFSPEPITAFQNAWVDLGLPDAGKRSWEEVVRARESAAGREYRQLASDLTAQAIAALSTGVNKEEIQREIERALVRQLVDEVFQRRPSSARAVINVGLNLIPCASLASSVDEAVSIIKDRRSWVSLLRDPA